MWSGEDLPHEFRGVRTPAEALRDVLVIASWPEPNEAQVVVDPDDGAPIDEMGRFSVRVHESGALVVCVDGTTTFEFATTAASELPGIGRQGFRGWSELLADMRAIAAAERPLNRVRISTPTARQRDSVPVGALAVEAGEDHVVLRVAGEQSVRVERSCFSRRARCGRYRPR